jgi:hypothetical protein
VLMRIKATANFLVLTGGLLFAAGGADAGGPVSLNESQLDNVTAGQGGVPFAAAGAAASALGLTVFGGTQTAAVIGIGSPGNDGPFGGSSAQASALAYGGGMNGVSPGSGSAQAATVAQTPGNFVANIGWNYTVYGIGTVLQGSVSSSTGLFVPGMP